MIVFIAMILVAAIAASVIIQTSESLQQRAYAVGRQTTYEVSSGIKVVDITGYTNAAKTKIQYLGITIQPRAGSFDIDLNSTYVYLEYNNLSVLSLDCSGEDVITSTISANGIFQTLNLTNISANEFGVIALRDTDGSITSTYGMGRHDLAMIMINLTATSAFKSTGGLGTGVDFVGRIVPETGSIGTFAIYSPKSYEYRVVEL